MAAASNALSVASQAAVAKGIWFQIRPERYLGRRKTMSSLKTQVLLREFYYSGVRIPDPGPELTVEQVRDLLTPTYPEIATASVTGPEDTGSALRYNFSRAIGSKG
jgi:PRTRC genetic system protein C